MISTPTLPTTNKYRSAFRVFLILALTVGMYACGAAVETRDGKAPTTPDLSSVPGNSYYFFSKAEISRQSGDLEKTIYWLNRAIHADPESAYLKQELAYIYLYEEAYEEALVLVNGILEDYPENVDALVMLAGIHQRQGESKKAADVYEKAIAIDPSLEKIYLILGSIYMADEAPQRAIDVYTRLTHQSPDLWDGYYFLAKTQKELGDPAAAEKNFNKCLELEPRLLSPRFELIALYKQQAGSAKTVTIKEGDTLYALCRKIYGQYSEEIADTIAAANPHIRDIRILQTGQTIQFPPLAADMDAATREKIISLYKGILADFPDNYKAAIGLALFYHHTDSPSKAVGVMKSLGEKSLSDIGVVQTLFQTLIESKEFTDARIVVAGMLEGAPASSGLHYLMGVILDETGEKEKALSHFQQVTEDTRYYENTLVHMAFLYEETGQTEKAEETFNQLIRKNPENPKFHLYLGSLYERVKAYEKAEALFSQGLEIAPDNIDLMFRLGVVFDKTGRKEAVIRQMQRLLEKDPNNASALNYLGYTYAELGENLDEAQSLVEAALKIKPDDPYITDSLGWVFFKKGDLEKALEMLEKAVRLAPTDPVLLEHLGDAYLQKGDTQKALEIYRRSLENSAEGVSEANPDEVKSKIEQILEKEQI
ncbi:MAG: tetratricopeptide repeat protein [Thermodesulfobacteriota bacterium]|nr:tetratricopeptide repeat protein [Thermodesulfobacteriota bacterium]